jgi:hypothetical protein
MTQKDHEDRFIEKCRKDFGALTWESELLLRYGFSTAAAELGRIAYAEGMEAQRSQVLDVLGAASQKERVRP